MATVCQHRQHKLARWRLRLNPLPAHPDHDQADTLGFSRPTMASRSTVERANGSGFATISASPACTIDCGARTRCGRQRCLPVRRTTSQRPPQRDRAAGFPVPSGRVACPGISTSMEPLSLASLTMRGWLSKINTDFCDRRFGPSAGPIARAGPTYSPPSLARRHAKTRQTIDAIGHVRHSSAAILGASRLAPAALPRSGHGATTPPAGFCDRSGADGDPAAVARRAGW